VLSISNETYQRNIKALPVSIEKIERFWLGTDIPSIPIDSQAEIEAIKNELNIPVATTVIGNVGRICSGKGQMELIEAFAILAPSHPLIHLLLVGALDVSEGSDTAFVTQIRSRVEELKLADRIHLAGFRKDTDRMLAAMDVVCLPNHNEAFGLTAIEAMAAKKAIVGANTGALPEILEPVALLCNPLAPDKIAQNIETYLHDTEMRSENAKLAFERAQKEFSMTSHISKLTGYYGFNNEQL
jgi:glycosyltransferase involved in cell wall biosynthesis